MNHRTFFLLIFTSIIVLNSSSSTAMDTSIDPLYKLIQTLRSYSSFVLHFEQESFNLTSNQTVKANGRLTFAVPDRFRWDYHSIPQNILASDGKTLLMLLPQDQQVMMEPAGNNKDVWSPIGVLIDPAALERNYNISASGNDDPVYSSFIIKPKDKKQFDQLQVLIPKVTQSTVFILKIYDLAGNQNSLSFSILTPGPSMFDYLPEIPVNFEITDFSGRPTRRIDLPETDNGGSGDQP